MAWEWSHTAEATDGFRAQLHAQPREWLLTVWAEWHAKHEPEDGEEYDEQRANAARSEAEQWMSNESLADAIFDLACDLATCTNGGWEAWACPYGCGCHTLPFDAPEEGGGEE